VHDHEPGIGSVKEIDRLLQPQGLIFGLHLPPPTGIRNRRGVSRVSDVSDFSCGFWGFSPVGVSDVSDVSDFPLHAFFRPLARVYFADSNRGKMGA
jgi:hypothetical protein